MDPAIADQPFDTPAAPAAPIDVDFAIDPAGGLLDAVPSGRLSGSLYGAEDPTASNATPEGRSRNRRVDVILTRLHQEP